MSIKAALLNDAVEKAANLDHRNFKTVFSISFYLAM